MQNDDQTIRFIEFIKRCPSGDNCQPWEITYQDKIVFFKYLPERDEHPFNTNESAKQFTLGFFREYCKIAAKHLGLSISLQNSDSDLAIEIDQITPAPDDKVIVKRFCDRRVYDRALTAKEVDSLGDIKANRLFESKLFNNLLKAHIFQAERMMWTDSSILKSFFKWVRFSKKEYYASRDGMHYSQLNSNAMDALFFKFVKKFTYFFTRIFKTPLFYLVFGKLKSFYKNNQMLVYTVKKIDLNEIESISSNVIKDWILINQKDFSYHPMNIICLPFFDKALSNDPKTREEGIKKLELIKEALNLDGYPVWMARIGYCQKPYPFMESLRL